MGEFLSLRKTDHLFSVMTSAHVNAPDKKIAGGKHEPELARRYCERVCHCA